MNFKKTVAIATAAGALTAISIPAMALENEFHGMYRVYGYMTNALSGGGGFQLKDGSATDKYLEQRARLQYTAKASDDLKLVTQFELDTKFGGQNTSTGAAASNKYPIGDAGALDADRITLETKNVYLDFNCPITGSNVKVGIQPFSDSYQGTFGNFDGAGVSISKKINSNLTASYSYFTIANTGTGTAFPTYQTASDMNVVNVNFAVNKDLTVGANYTNVLSGADSLFLNMIGVNAAAKVGPAAVTASLGYQIGDSTTGTDLSAFGGAVAAKVNVGPGKVNVSAVYLSGDDAKAGSDNTGWQVARSDVTYFNPANMWLIHRNAATINSSTAIGGSSDMTRGGRGIIGVFAGYEGAFDKIFYNANVGYAQVAEERTADSAAIGTELNVTAGYKLYANLSVSATAAYAIIGDGYGKSSGTLLPGGVKNADNPFLTNIALNYIF